MQMLTIRLQCAKITVHSSSVDMSRDPSGQALCLDVCLTQEQAGILLETLLNVEDDTAMFYDPSED